MEIDVKYIGDDIHFTVLDEDVGTDDVVGDCVVKLSDFIGDSGKLDDWWQINFEGKPAGHIHLKSFWTPRAEPLKEKPPASQIKQPPL